MRQHRMPTRATILAAAAVLAATALPGNAAAIVTGHSGTGRPALAHAGTGPLYIGWTGTTGTATAKELDLGSSLDQGKTITKVSWTERVPQGQGPALSIGGTGVFVAWVAGNHANALTAEYYDGTALNCRTEFTGVTSPYAPAMVTDPAGVRYLAWTDTAGHLNVAHLDSSGCATTHTMRLTNRVTLPDTSVAGPALVYDSSGSSNLGVLIAWTGTEATHPIHVATYVGTATLTKRSTVPSAIGTSGAPGLGVADSDLYLGFIGTDGNVYFAYSEGCVPTCFNAAATGEDGTAGFGIDPDMNVVWSAFFDANGHLNIDNLYHQ